MQAETAERLPVPICAGIGNGIFGYTISIVNRFTWEKEEIKMKNLFDGISRSPYRNHCLVFLMVFICILCTSCGVGIYMILSGLPYNHWTKVQLFFVDFVRGSTKVPSQKVMPSWQNLLYVGFKAHRKYSPDRNRIQDSRTSGWKSKILNLPARSASFIW